VKTTSLILKKLLIITAFLGCTLTSLFPQEVATTDTTEKKLFLIIKNDGTEYVGYIIKQDEREVLIETSAIGRLYIPKHEIKSIREINESDYKRGQYLGNDIFSTRYFYSTNSLSMNKGNYYAMFNLYGPEIHYAVSDKFSIGGLTSWLGVPIVGSLKYAIPAGKNLSFGLGSLIGWTTWAEPSGFGILPYGTMTLGNYNENFNISAGYIYVTAEAEKLLSGPAFSIAGIKRIGKKVAFVGDSFIYIKEEFIAVIIPGLRFSSSPNNAFQIGFAGIITEEEVLPFPMPFIGWFRIF
jgi:hypothetical protein